MADIASYDPLTSLRAFFGSRDARQVTRAFALETFLLDWAATGAVSVFSGPGPDPTTLSDYGSDKLWLRTNPGVNSTAGSVRIWNGNSPASDEGNWPSLTKARFLDYLGVSISGADLSVYATRAAAVAATIDSGKTFLVVQGYASLQDGGSGVYRKLAVAPSPVKAWHFQSADGAYWELQPENGSVNVRALGATGDGVSDDIAAISAAIDYWAPFSTPAAGGGMVWLPPGTYAVSASIDMTGCHGIKIFGAGPLATEVKATGDFPVFYHVGSSGTPLNKAAISHMTIRGGGKGNASSHGVSWTWTNGCEIEDVVIYACRHGLHLAHQWQTYLTDIDSQGSSSDKCYIGVYLAETTTGVVDNAVIAHGLSMKDCELYGYQIVNGQGSKWTSCEAGACVVGWYIGGVPAGAPPCEWMHFANCLGDSCAHYNWQFLTGTAAYVGNMSFVGCWSGNAGIHNVMVSGGKFLSFSGGVSQGANEAGLYLLYSTACTVSGIAFSSNNKSASASVYDITVSNSTYISVTGNACQSYSGTSNFGELGTSNNNIVLGNSLPNGALISGAATKVARNQGTNTEKNGSTTLAVGTNSVVVTHSLGVTPTLDDIVVQAKASMDAVGIKDLWVSATTSTTFTVTANTNATGSLAILWQAKCKA